MRARSPHVRRRVSVWIAAAAFVLSAAGTASAADPILPLDQVRPGMVARRAPS